MDLEIKIKEEPDWFGGIASTSLENFELESANTCLKEETKPELMEVGLLQLAADIKDEIIIDEPAVEELVPLLKEENSVKSMGELAEGPVHLFEICFKAFDQRSVPVSSSTFTQKGTNSDEGRYYCPVCRRSFKRKVNFERHLCTRSGERQYCCSECTSVFARKEHLQDHYLIHSGGKQHSCQTCNSMFTRKYDLKRHELTHSSERPFPCSLCNCKFTEKTRLNSHLRSHSDPRPYQCTICSSKFFRKSGLESHMFSHSSEGSFRCYICNITFTRKEHLRNHCLVHLAEKPVHLFS